MPAPFPGAVPEIPVSDLATAAAYYQHCLGFTLDWSDEDSGWPASRAATAGMLLASRQFRQGHGNVGPTQTWLNLDGNDAGGRLYRDWRSRDARLISAPESKPWGLHEFTAADPDGNRFRVFYDFATPAGVDGSDARSRAERWR